MITVNEAVKILGWSDSYIRRMCREGRMKGAAKIGRDWLLSEKEVWALRKSLDK